MNTRSRTIFIILLSALLVSLLFNFRALIRIYEALAEPDLGEELEGKMKAGIKFRLQYAWFNLIIEFAVYTIAAFFNLSWFDRLLPKFKVKKWNVLLLVAGNLVLYFILIPPAKLFHIAYFAEMESIFRKDIEFDIHNYLLINVFPFLLAILVANLLKIMKQMRIAEA